jgi:hypothetical protein
MKATMFLNRKMSCTLLAVLGFARLACASEPTALELIKEADRYVGEDVKGKVIQIRSEKSVGTLVPNIWTVVYYDQDATFKTTEVKLGAGRKLDLSHPLRQPFAYIKADNELSRDKVKIDSDKAIKIATSEPLLSNLKLTATRLSLEPSDHGPIWKVRLWAAKLRHPNDDADIGEVEIAADDGKVIHSDLHINRVD